MTTDYNRESRVADRLRDLFLHLTLTATGDHSPFSDSEAAQIAADAYRDITGEEIA